MVCGECDHICTACVAGGLYVSAVEFVVSDSHVDPETACRKRIGGSQSGGSRGSDSRDVWDRRADLYILSGVMQLNALSIHTVVDVSILDVITEVRVIVRVVLVVLRPVGVTNDCGVVSGEPRMAMAIKITHSDRDCAAAG